MVSGRKEVLQETGDNIMYADIYAYLYNDRTAVPIVCGSFFDAPFEFYVQTSSISLQFFTLVRN